MMININRIKKLVKTECAGYSSEQYSIYHYCCSIGGVCVFFGEIKKSSCRYFEEGVLPLDSDLEHCYCKENQKEIVHNRQVKPKFKCERCKEIFEANSNRQKHCEKCRKVVKKEQAKQRMQKMRKKVLSYALDISQS